MTVLIADADRDLASLLAVGCRRMGLKVLATHDASTTLALLQKCRPDIICLDLEMPGDRGVALGDEISQSESLGEIPLVALTGRYDPDTILRCHALGAFYVEKGPEIWNGLESLLKVLVAGPSGAGRGAGGRESTPSGENADSNESIVVASTPSETPTTESTSSCEFPGPCPCPGPCPSGSPPAPIENATSVVTPLASSGVPGISEQNPTIEETNQRTSEPSESSPENASQDIDGSQDIAADAPTEPDAGPETGSVWRRLAEAVGRVVERTVKTDEADVAVGPKSAPTQSETGSDESAEGPADSDETTPASADAAREHQPQGPSLEEAARIAELDKAWTTIGSGKSASHAQTPTAKQGARTSREKKQGEPEKTILIADDDGDLVQMLAIRCGDLGLRVFRSPDAMHALLGAHRVWPDLILVDVHMPGGNGLSVCEMLASDHTLHKIPVIVMTGDASEEIPRRCEQLDAECVLKGPGLWERLEPAIRRSLGMPPRANVGETASSVDSEGNAGPRRPKVLCIDDDPEISKILKIRLERFDVDVLRAFNGMQGYWTALDMRPDLIILDMVMPDGAGNYIFGRLRAHPLTEKVPVLMLTGVNTPGVRRQMFGLGVDAYLTKPLDFNALLEHIRQYVPLDGKVPAAKSSTPADPSDRATTDFLAAGAKEVMAV